MAATDPHLGTANHWRGDPIQAGAEPTLYHAESHYASMVARLGLVERGCAWRSRVMDIHNHTEQACTSPRPAKLWGTASGTRQGPLSAHGVGPTPSRVQLCTSLLRLAPCCAVGARAGE